MSSKYIKSSEKEIPFVILDNDYGPGGNMEPSRSRKRKQTTVVQKKAQMECHVIYIEDEDDEEDDKIRIKSDPPQRRSKKRPLVTAFCGICMDTKPASEMFQNTKVCDHQFCSECIRGHVAAKIQENQIKITCPEPSCQVMIGPEACRSIVPQEVLERWEKILCESVIMEAQKFYCPFNDCSAMLVDDGGVAVTSSECPFCHRLFCAQCKVAWHGGMSCAEFQSVKKGDDNLLMNLAKKKKWMQCPKCKVMVEKVIGCHHIRCRCGHQFCYGCGTSAIGGQHFTTCTHSTKRI